MRFHAVLGTNAVKKIQNMNPSQINYEDLFSVEPNGDFLNSRWERIGKELMWTEFC